jgi:hypothetical protein
MMQINHARQCGNMQPGYSQQTLEFRKLKLGMKVLVRLAGDGEDYIRAEIKQIKSESHIVCMDIDSGLLTIVKSSMVFARENQGYAFYDGTPMVKTN